MSRIPIANNDLIIEIPANEENRISAEVKGDFNNPLNLPLNNYSPTNENETVQDMNMLMNNDSYNAATIPTTPAQNETNFREIFSSSNAKSKEKTPKQIEPNKMTKEEVINEIMRRENPNDDLRLQELTDMGKRALNKTLTNLINPKIDPYLTPKKRMTFK